MARRPEAFTVLHFGRTHVVHVRNRGQLADKLHELLPWVLEDCWQLATRLFGGAVVTAPDYETIIFRGAGPVATVRPEERDQCLPGV